MQEIVLRAQNLSKRFGRQILFVDFSFELTGPGLYAIVGRNGSGKSTLLKILSGILTPTSGQIILQINEQKINEIDYKKMSFAAPYQELPEELSLPELVSFYNGFRHLNLPIPIDVYESFQLPKTGDKPIKSFSSGMKQRVRLGLAFFTDAPLLFLDEPTSNLDAAGIEWYRHYVRILSEHRLIVVSSNHHLDEYPDANGILEIQ